MKIFTLWPSQSSDHPRELVGGFRQTTPQSPVNMFLMNGCYQRSSKTRINKLLPVEQHRTQAFYTQTNMSSIANVSFIFLSLEDLVSHAAIAFVILEHTLQPVGADFTKALLIFGVFLSFFVNYSTDG